MSSVLADLVVYLNRDGYEASFNAKYGTIDITRVHGRPTLDPWPLQIRPEHLRDVLDALAKREGVGSSEALALLAAMIEGDVALHDPSDGPFTLDHRGYVMRPFRE